MNIGFAYNLKTDKSIQNKKLEDADTDYEDKETIDALESALLKISAKVIHLPCNKNFVENVLKNRPNIDMVFNIAEGWGSRNRESLAPSLYELLDLPYTGSDALTMGLTMDKELSKRLFLAAGVPTPEYILIKNIADLKNIDLEFPLFVKPNNEGTSMGIRNNSKVHNFAELQERTNWVLNTYKQPALIEKFIAGSELASAIIGNQSPEFLPLIEITFQQDKSPFYSFECKLNIEETLICPVEIDKELFNKIKDYTFRLWNSFNLKDFARFDIIIDKDGTPYFLEINALPGLSKKYSLFPVQAEAHGYNFDNMIKKITERTLKQLEDKK